MTKNNKNLFLAKFKNHLDIISKHISSLPIYQKFLIKNNKIKTIKDLNKITVKDWKLKEIILEKINQNNTNIINIARAINTKEGDLLKIINAEFDEFDLFYIINKIKILSKILNIDYAIIDCEIRKIRKSFDEHQINNYKLLNIDEENSLEPSIKHLNISCLAFIILFILYLLIHNYNFENFEHKITEDIIILFQK